MGAVPAREIVSVSRGAEYLDARELAAQTGVAPHRLADAVLKELVDNALDACETAGATPEITVGVVWTSSTTMISVSDNGTGITPDVVSRILNFDTRTSDKLLWRSPTRGAQGNALKTVLGIPTALAAGAPVMPVTIDSRGVLHEIALHPDLLGNVRVDHVVRDADPRPGTAVQVTLSGSRLSPSEVADWGLMFALANPHAGFEVRIRGPHPHRHLADDGGWESVGSYRPTVVGGYRKPIPTDPTSPAWYTAADFERLVNALAGTDEQAGTDRTVRQFVRGFAGLTGTAKAKAIGDQVGVDRLSQLAGDTTTITWLLAVMQVEARAPKPQTLGRIPDEHVVEILDNTFGVQRAWQRRGAVVDDAGVPWILELTVAATVDDGWFYPAVNWSPVFADPTGGHEIHGDRESAYGVRGFLSTIGLFGDGSRPAAATLHIITPSIRWLDRGKSRASIPDEVIDRLSEMTDRATRELQHERRAAERAWSSQQRAAAKARDAERSAKPTLREACFDVMAEAYAKATGDGATRCAARSLAYGLRERIFNRHGLAYGGSLAYFTQKVIPDYVREVADLPLVFWEPRGILLEPHGGREVPLGTREAESYALPEWTFDKLLVVEKKGLRGTLEDARLAERYDLAIVLAEGFSSTGARQLIEQMPAHDVRVFVVHDADPSGANIARTIGEATARMPDHHVDVVDLGLTPTQAVDLGLPTEVFFRDRALPAALELDELEQEWWIGEPTGKRRNGREIYRCTRCELNAFTGPGLVAFIEEQLAAHGATGKVVPPAEVTSSSANDEIDVRAAAIVKQELDRILDLSDVLDEIQREVADDVGGEDDWRAQIEGLLVPGSTLSWRDALTIAVGRRVQPHDVDAREHARQRLVAALVDRLQELAP